VDPGSTPDGRSLVAVRAGAGIRVASMGLAACQSAGVVMLHGLGSAGGFRVVLLELFGIVVDALDGDDC
jgi:hypothetical protein